MMTFLYILGYLVIGSVVVTLTEQVVHRTHVFGIHNLDETSYGLVFFAWPVVLGASAVLLALLLGFALGFLLPSKLVSLPFETYDKLKEWREHRRVAKAWRARELVEAMGKQEEQAQ